MLKNLGTVTVIVTLLASSAAFRLVTSAGSVLAANAQQLEQTREVAENEPKTAQNVTEDDEAFDALLELLQQREARIEQQEAFIEDRMAKLREAEQQVEQKLIELGVAEEKLRATVAVASSAAEDDLARLTAVYESMKPKTAAALFEEMAPEFAAGFLGRMRPESAAAVMAGMAPEIAYTVSAILAGRNANIPIE